MNDEQHNNQPTPEEELGVLENDTHRIIHAGCGGRVIWIKGEEHRCFKCVKSVPAEEMEFPDEENDGA